MTYPLVLEGASLIDDYTFSESTLREAGWIPWEQFCSLLERIEARLGGSERMDELILRHAREAAPEASMPRSMRAERPG